MTQREAIISLDCTSYAPIPILYGLPQGSQASPILFLLAIQNALRILTNIFDYADDIAIFASAPSIPQCTEILQNQLTQKITWDRENGIPSNSKKQN